MRVVFCFLLACFISFGATAQKVYFIYLQTENNTPFYLKMGDRIFSSSNSGYLILSGLADSTQQFSIGISSGTTESRFSIPLQGKDRGFLIRNTPSTVLVDLQTHSTVKPLPDALGKGVSYRARNDAFTSLLALAANDTTLLYVIESAPSSAVALETKSPQQEERPSQTNSSEKGSDTNISVAVNDNSELKKTETTESSGNVVKDTTELVVEKKPDVVSVIPEVEYKRSVVKKHAESSTSEGFGLVFYDISESSTDTIRLMIPNPKIQFKKVETEDTSGMLVLNRDSLKKVTQNQTLPPCKVIATEADFFKLRKLMAARTSDDAMVDEARKSFRSKCFTTEQVRNLSTLFLTSAGKFQFFESAYRHISDVEQFPSLASEIRDDYYSKRFKTLAGD